MKSISSLSRALLLSLVMPLLAPSEPLEDSYDRLGKDLLQSLRERSYTKLKALTPSTPAICRKLAPDEFGSMTDRQIVAKLRKNYYPKLRRDFEGIMKSARRRRIDLSKLEFVAAKPHAGEPGGPVGVEIVYRYREMRGTLAIAAADVDGKYYLTEILISHDPFSRLVAE